MVQNNKKKFKILILGGRGFVGKAICKLLKNHSVFTFDTKPGSKNHFQGDITSFDDLKRAIRRMDYVVNLVALCK